MAEPQPDAPALLRLLQGFIKRDPAPPGFDGVISAVVRTELGDYYWCGLFSQTKSQSGYLRYVPQNADAVLIIGAREAEALVTDGKLPADAELAEVSGNRKLYDRFVQRYLVKTNWLDVFASAQTDRPKRRRKRR